MDWLNRIAEVFMGKDQSQTWQIVTLGFDGQPRTLSWKFDSMISAQMEAWSFSALHYPVPFTVRPSAK